MNSRTLYAILRLLSQIWNACSHITQFRGTNELKRGTSVDKFKRKPQEVITLYLNEPRFSRAEKLRLIVIVFLVERYPKKISKLKKVKVLTNFISQPVLHFKTNWKKLWTSTVATPTKLDEK